MALEEANKYVTISICYSPNGWYWTIDTNRPYGKILGYAKYENTEDVVTEVKDFLRYFTENVLKDGDTIRKYVEKHKPKKENE